MHFKLKSPLLFSDIPPVTHDSGRARKHYKIAAIDDEGLPHLDRLKAIGFEIVSLSDIQDLTLVQSYLIVACDIMGVGRSFTEADTGGTIILKEIRKQYPDKYLIGYTAGSFDASISSVWTSCDTSLTRSRPVEDWTEVFDKAIETVSQPSRYWQRIRKQLLATEMSAFEIYLLEDKFIRSVLHGQPYIFDKEFKRMKKKKQVTDTAERIVGGVHLAIELFTLIGPSLP